MRTFFGIIAAFVGVGLAGSFELGMEVTLSKMAIVVICILGVIFCLVVPAYSEPEKKIPPKKDWAKFDTSRNHRE